MCSNKVCRVLFETLAKLGDTRTAERLRCTRDKTAIVVSLCPYTRIQKGFRTTHALSIVVCLSHSSNCLNERCFITNPSRL